MLRPYNTIKILWSTICFVYRRVFNPEKSDIIVFPVGRYFPSLSRLVVLRVKNNFHCSEPFLPGRNTRIVRSFLGASIRSEINLTQGYQSCNCHRAKNKNMWWIIIASMLGILSGYLNLPKVSDVIVQPPPPPSILVLVSRTGKIMCFRTEAVSCWQNPHLSRYSQLLIWADRES